MKYVIFTGEESETEFLDKCLQQWELSSNEENTMMSMVQLGSMFSEMRHRISAIKEKEEKLSPMFMFNGSTFIKPSKEFQDQWGIKRLEVELTEDGAIKHESISRYPSAACVNWSGWNDEGED